MSMIEKLPRWSTTDLHESLESRSFKSATEQLTADVVRLVALFDEHDVRAVPPREPNAADGAVADAVIRRFNEASRESAELFACVYATVATNSRDEHAQALLSQLADIGAQTTPLLARLAAWVASLGVEALTELSEEARQHAGPLARLALRSTHQMSEPEEGLYAELATNGSGAWNRLQSDVTSQLIGTVRYADGSEERLPMPAVRGLAMQRDESVRRSGYEAELESWPTIATPVAAALNAVKGEANTVNRRRTWASPLDAALFANSVSRPTFDAMQEAVTEGLPDLRRWMRLKNRIHFGVGETAAQTTDTRTTNGGLPWWNLVAPLPVGTGEVSWDAGLDVVRSAFAAYSPQLGQLVDRAVAEDWMDAPPSEGKQGGAFCLSFFDDRSLVLLNWSGSMDSVQTTAHELGHAYHNVALADRTPLQRRLPMALAETASIFCETLVVDAGLRTLQGPERLALLDLDLAGSVQTIVDIRSRFLFEQNVFERRGRRTLGVEELNELMTGAQGAAYGDGLDQTTAHPYMWLLKGHYYGAHFYNWPYTYGLLFGLGLFARYSEDAERFRSGYDTMLSRVGMDSAEQLGASFGLDVTSVAFWTASMDVLRSRIAEYESLAIELQLI